MFGIRILTRAGVRSIRNEAFIKAFDEIVELLRSSGKVYLKPVTMVGDDQTIKRCVFLGINGPALTIKSKVKGTKVVSSAFQGIVR